MTCQSTVTGAGVNSNTCANANNSGSFVFDGIVTADPGFVGPCSGYFLIVNGQPYRRDYFFHASGFSITYSGCNQGVNPDQPCDCINGGCLPATIYNTPGKYANFAACESGCAKDSTCTGECVSAAEIAALKQAASNLRSRLCK